MLKKKKRKNSLLITNITYTFCRLFWGTIRDLCLYTAKKWAGNLCNPHPSREIPSLQAAMVSFTQAGFWSFAHTNGCVSFGSFCSRGVRPKPALHCARGRMPGSLLTSHCDLLGKPSPAAQFLYTCFYL